MTLARVVQVPVAEVRLTLAEEVPVERPGTLEAGPGGFRPGRQPTPGWLQRLRFSDGERCWRSGSGRPESGPYPGAAGSAG